MKVNISQIKKKVVPVLKEAGVAHSSLFGSSARGEMRKDSDIDILVELPQGKSLLDLVDLEMKLAKILGRKVDLLTYNSISTYLKDYIQKEQLPLL